MRTNENTNENNNRVSYKGIVGASYQHTDGIVIIDEEEHTFSPMTAKSMYNKHLRAKQCYISANAAYEEYVVYVDYPCENTSKVLIINEATPKEEESIIGARVVYCNGYFVIDFKSKTYITEEIGFNNYTRFDEYEGILTTNSIIETLVTNPKRAAYVWDALREAMTRWGMGKDTPSLFDLESSLGVILSNDFDIIDESSWWKNTGSNIYSVNKGPQGLEVLTGDYSETSVARTIYSGINGEWRITALKYYNGVAKEGRFFTYGFSFSLENFQDKEYYNKGLSPKSASEGKCPRKTSENTQVEVKGNGVEISKALPYVDTNLKRRFEFECVAFDFKKKLGKNTFLAESEGRECICELVYDMDDEMEIRHYHFDQKNMGIEEAIISFYGKYNESIIVSLDDTLVEKCKDVTITRQESLDAGNCSYGTDKFLAKLGKDSITFKELHTIFKVRKDSDIERVLKYVANFEICKAEYLATK